jgi:hypothetical protein
MAMEWLPIGTTARVTNCLRVAGVNSPAALAVFLSDPKRVWETANLGMGSIIRLVEIAGALGIKTDARSLHRCQRPTACKPLKEPGASVYLLRSDMERLIAATPASEASDKLRVALAKLMLRAQPASD